ncbi:Intersectin-1 [Eumeta japonica]|uniref:Intersectin-1 n=1 Tax=Eumeta variegata TaxID=151549 RepID=A0A4C2AH26_EUMVA|nr:Intersectin-1 [Eumeta japonica]
MAPAAMTGIPPMQQVAGAVPVMPSAMIPAATGVPGVAGVAGMPIVTQPSAIPGVPVAPMMPGVVVPGVVPGMPAVPGGMPTAVVPGIPPVPPAPKIVTPPTANEPKVTPPTSNLRVVVRPFGKSALLNLHWIPPSFRKAKSRTSSVSGAGSRPGSQTASRHASVSSQGAPDDPLAASFEDKRKENFDKGQAELDRRRKLLQEQQQAERKQQEELKLQKQRELELEKEEQRKRELEAKETARKSLECKPSRLACFPKAHCPVITDKSIVMCDHSLASRAIENLKSNVCLREQSRIAELNSQKQREQERAKKKLTIPN